MAVWDAALAAVRAVLRGAGLREVVTPVRLSAVAIEPFIEPVAAPPGLLATSPELPMKRLLCAGAPSIFQIATCFRAGEIGDLHREELHLVEWYRLDADTGAMRADVERVVASVFEAVAEVLREPDDPVTPPRSYDVVGMLDLVEETLDVTLRGDEDAEALAAALAPVRVRLRDPLATVPHERLASSPRAHALAAWTAFFSAWSDAALDPWLAARTPARGVHLVDFPVPLAALSAVAPEAGPGLAPRGERRSVAHRFESHVHGRELANGYRELRDADEQRERFEAVNALRVALELPALPIDTAFIEDLRRPGLPPCAGVALGLDRLVLLACGRSRLADVAIELGAPGT